MRNKIAFIIKTAHCLCEVKAFCSFQIKTFKTNM